MTIHKDKHHLPESLVKHVYRGIDEKSKVQLLMYGIETNTTKYVKMNITTEEKLRKDFDNFAKQYEEVQHEVKVAALG